jgi:hypothetical protein
MYTAAMMVATNVAAVTTPEMTESFGLCFPNEVPRYTNTNCLGSVRKAAALYDPKCAPALAETAVTMCPGTAEKRRMSTNVNAFSRMSCVNAA